MDVANAMLSNKTWVNSVLSNLKFSINFSGYHFKKKNVLEIMESVLAISNIDLHFLEIELSEA
jgi:EAL domain-containing protein (putative c-di-GMP-specific phosphodiesterase class I)